MICSNPDGVEGHGYHPLKSVCWITAAHQVALRRWDKLHAKAQPDAAGYLPTDGVRISVGLYDDPDRDPFPRRPGDDVRAALAAPTTTTA